MHMHIVFNLNRLLLLPPIRYNASQKFGQRARVDVFLFIQLAKCTVFPECQFCNFLIYIRTNLKGLFIFNIHQALATISHYHRVSDNDLKS